MSAGWIKMRVDLVNHPKVVRIASALNADKRPATRAQRVHVVGGLYAIWAVFDAHSVDGSLEGYTPETLDEEIGWPGFCNAMGSVNWLMFDGDLTVSLPEFEEHNGSSAKRRALEAKRKREEREAEREAEKAAGQPPKPVRKTSASNADTMRTREEKRREEISSPNGEEIILRDFALVWSEYPSRPGRSRVNALKAYRARLNAGADPQAILEGVQRYAAYVQVMKTEPHFIKQPETFLGPGDHYLADWTPTARTPTKAEQSDQWTQNLFRRTNDEHDTIDGEATIVTPADAGTGGD